MKKLLLLCLIALCALTTWAGSNDKYNFSVDGIYYYILDDSNVAVIDSAYQATTSTYAGDLVIPASVEYEGTHYTVSSIFEYAFYRCYDLTSITLPETVTSIGGYAFGHCTSLTDISFLEGFTMVSYCMFLECTGLETITLPESIETMEDGVFQGCENLREVTIGSKLTTLDYYDFAFCTSLEKFYSLNPEPPTCVTYTDRMGMTMTTFDGASIATCTLYVPAGSKEKYEAADQWKEFGNIVEMDETITPPTVETISVTDITNSTATLYGMVTAGSEEIVEQGFQYWADTNATQTILATDVSDDGEISSTIQRLSSATEYTYRAYAQTSTDTFYGDQMTFTTTDYDFAEENSDGQTIYYKILSSSSRTCTVQYLYYASADNIVAYEGELTIPETVTHDGTTYRVVMIDEYAFYECRNLTKVVIPESVTDIGMYSFYNCTSLEEATFPNTVSTIWEYTFYGCEKLKEIIIPSSIKTIRQRVFVGCNSITELTVPETVKTLETAIFANCANLKKVTLADGVTNTGYAYMFAGCTSLEEVSMPNTMTSLGSYTFGGCTGLKSFTYPNSMTNTGFCTFYECTGLENVTFSENTTEISDGTFAYCTFEEMTVPEGVTTIGYQAFLGNQNLKILSLPRSVTSIDYWVLRYCSNIEKLYSLNPTPPVRGAHPQFETFEDMSENCVLYVPAGSREDYSTADMWAGFFKDIVEVALVETFEADSVGTTSAILKGAVTAGDTPITKEGFEYWANEKPEAVTTITLSGNEQEISYNLSGLQLGTSYTYRAFAVTDDGTFYGEDVEFTTEDIPDGIDNVGMSSTNSENIEGIYSTSGQKLNTTVKGVNIIRYTDGTTKKVLVK